tara:strand:+ start:195 stop:794 length:600 start_codon:yes stop_codon:yes gene_type:complete
MAWTLTNADVISAFPLLADFHEKADGGSTTTLECKRLLHLSDVEVIGSTITILTGTNAGTDVLITSYASSTTATFGFSALSNPIDSSVGFGIVLMDYTSVINRAYNIIVNEMRNRGLDVNLFLTVTQLKELHLTKTLELICLSKRQDADNNDIYHESYLLFKEQYESELTTLKADYDEDEDGVIQESEEDISNQVVLRK